MSRRTDKVQRIPLEERLEKAAACEADFLGVFSLYTDDYFYGCSIASRDQRFAGYYRKALDGRGPCRLPEFISGLKELEDREEENMLYHVLVWPFARRWDFERKVYDNG